MKKLVQITSLMLVFCCVVVLFVACNSGEHDRIKADYAKIHNLDKSSVEFTCYAEFDGSHVLMFNGVYPTALSSEIVDGVIFQHPCIQTFDVYHDGNFYSLQEAFDNGLLTHDDLVTLRDIYNPQYMGLVF